MWPWSEVIRKMAGKGFEVVVEPGAGSDAMLSDEAFEEAGATISDDVWSAEVVAKVAAPSDEEIAKLREGTILVGFLGPLSNPHSTQALAAGRASFGMEGIPRISRAQKMDALSSQANIAGYKAVLIAAESLGEVLSDADDRRRHRARRARARDRRRRGRAAGDRHRAPARARRCGATTCGPR